MEVVNNENTLCSCVYLPSRLAAEFLKDKEKWIRAIVALNKSFRMADIGDFQGANRLARTVEEGLRGYALNYIDGLRKKYAC